MSFRAWVLVPALAWATAAQPAAQSAHADIVNAQEQKVGTAETHAFGSGVRIDVNVSQLPPGRSQHRHRPPSENFGLGGWVE
jgi:Cu/Zn superoxide dismutase